ncbi:MAG: GlsB/YeaQ/YmgE family stress response membrane protein [bacterium]|nr:GlsB/YeaQ/YmgE family stress response membrane protein [bacterium]MDE0602374.1 GlsB/YeaQ/YmgE family stress response membrane protein [bacterium]
MFGFLLSVVIAALAGGIGARLAGRRSTGCWASIALGWVGSLLGTWLAGLMGWPTIWEIQGFPVVWAIFGAALFVAVLNLLSGQGTRRQPPS